MKRERGQGNISGLAALMVFGVFALCILLVLLTGADRYQRLNLRDQSAYSHRTAVQYVATRVRQADKAGALSVGQLGGADALFIAEEYDGVSYVTCVYCYEGTLRELFTFADEPLAPEDGEILLPLQGLELELDGQLLTARLTDETGEMQHLNLFLRSGEGAAP